MTEYAVVALLVTLGGLLLMLVNSVTVSAVYRTRNYLLAGCLLPLIALVITKAISSSVLLSLGMLGALSIIRYRTPVKGVYELALLFGLVTLGVTAGVKPWLAAGLVGVMIAATVVIAGASRLAPRWIPAEERTGGSCEYLVCGDAAVFEQLQLEPRSIKTLAYLNEQGTRRFEVAALLPDMAACLALEQRHRPMDGISSISIRAL